jgi:hypothetical protein
MPPQSIATGSIEGTVVDSESGEPVAGMTVTLAFEGAGTANPSAVTDARGHYVIADVPQGRYGELVASGRHHDERRRSVTVGSGLATVDFSVGR